MLFYMSSIIKVFNNTTLLTCAKSIGAGAATVGVAGAGLVLGSVFGNYVIAVGNCPLIKKQLFSYTILGFALSITIFYLVMAFLILYKYAVTFPAILDIWNNWLGVHTYGIKDYPD